ncbi:hypothetical protein Rcae01_05644 [Novipirellula caenicola]|uniref:Uncharacterized protein n=1 Tax=Novipirellula caenicola TaxID=1536901 RepID=A0ABP9W0Y0_9BACT
MPLTTVRFIKISQVFGVWCDPNSHIKIYLGHNPTAHRVDPTADNIIDYRKIFEPCSRSLSFQDRGYGLGLRLAQFRRYSNLGKNRVNPPNTIHARIFCLNLTADESRHFACRKLRNVKLGKNVTRNVLKISQI